MKKVIALIAVFVFSASMLFNAFVVADYFVQYDYYSQVLCVNKDKPQLKCNGTCHLKADLAQEEQPNAPLPELREFKVDCTVASIDFDVLPTTVPELKQNFKPFQTVLPQDVVHEILQPPRTIVLA